MKLQSKRIVRTLQSEQYAFFDLDHLDQEGLPRSLGKADLHFTDLAAYGTVLLWRAHFGHMPDAELRSFVQALMDELGTPMGVPSEFLIECVLADEQEYRVYSNMLEAEGLPIEAVSHSN
jgi:hypothetical protein